MFKNISLLKKAQMQALVLVICVAAVVTVTLRATASIAAVNTEVTTRGIPFLVGTQEFRFHVVQIQ